MGMQAQAETGDRLHVPRPHPGTRAPWFHNLSAGPPIGPLSAVSPAIWSRGVLKVHGGVFCTLGFHVKMTLKKISSQMGQAHFDDFCPLRTFTKMVRGQGLVL